MYCSRSTAQELTAQLSRAKLSTGHVWGFSRGWRSLLGRGGAAQVLPPWVGRAEAAGGGEEEGGGEEPRCPPPPPPTEPGVGALHRSQQFQADWSPFALPRDRSSGLWGFLCPSTQIKQWCVAKDPFFQARYSLMATSLHWTKSKGSGNGEKAEQMRSHPLELGGGSQDCLPGFSSVLDEPLFF